MQLIHPCPCHPMPFIAATRKGIFREFSPSASFLLSEQYSLLPHCQAWAPRLKGIWEYTDIVVSWVEERNHVWLPCLCTEVIAPHSPQKNARAEHRLPAPSWLLEDPEKGLVTSVFSHSIASSEVLPPLWRSYFYLTYSLLIIPKDSQLKLPGRLDSLSLLWYLTFSLA